MWVKFIRGCTGTLGAFQRGEVAEIADSVAGAWIEARIVEPSAPPKANEEPPKESRPEVQPEPETAAVSGGETAVRPRGRPRKVR